jgi:hypothetical protein
MTARARFTQAELTRAIRAAEACGKLAVLTPQGIAFVESDSVALPSPEQARGNSCDKAFGP